MKRAVEGATREDTIWLTPRGTPGVLTVNIEGTLYKMPPRLYRHTRTLMAMIEDVGGLDTIMDAAMELLVTRPTWERILECLNVIDLWSEDRARCLVKLGEHLTRIQTEQERGSNESGKRLAAVDLLVVANYLDCPLLVEALLTTLVAYFKRQTYYPRDVKDDPRMPGVLKRITDEFQAEYNEPLVLDSGRNTNPGYDAPRLFKVAVLLEEQQLPEDVRMLILRALLPAQPPTIACGWSHMMIVSPRGDRLLAGGYAHSGQLGVPPLVRQGDFQEVGGIQGRILSIGCGNAHTVILTTVGLFGTGANYYGQIGSAIPIGENQEVQRFTAMDTSSVTGQMRQVACGGNFTLVLTTEGVFGCGSNASCQLGQNEKRLPASASFVRLDYGLEGTPRRIAAGNNHTLILTNEGLFACGLATHFQLGVKVPFGTDRLYKLSRMEGLPDADDILSFSGGAEHSLALTRTGLYATGRGYYGVDKKQHRSMHVISAPVGQAEIKGATCGYYSTFAWSSEALVAAGKSSGGQLGMRDTDENDYAVRFRRVFEKYSEPSSALVTSVACGGILTLIAFADGTIVTLPTSRNQSRVTLPENFLSQPLRNELSLACRHCSAGNATGFARELTNARMLFCAQAQCQQRFYDALDAACASLDSLTL